MTRYQGAAWINLQHGLRRNDMNQPHGLGVAPLIFSEAFRYDLDAMAALLVSLDLVITQPGYIAHLAGALGVRTWLLLPHGADWRHTIDCASQADIMQPRSLWHPSIKMYQQAKGETWEHFFVTLQEDLEKFLTTYRPPEEMPVVLTLPKRRTLSFPKAA